MGSNDRPVCPHFLLPHLFLTLTDSCLPYFITLLAQSPPPHPESATHNLISSVNHLPRNGTSGDVVG